MKQILFMIALAIGTQTYGGLPALDLLEGNTLDQWYSKPVETGGWSINEAGVVHLIPKGGSLSTKETFKDFDFTFEWKISKGGNSGVFYRAAKGRSPEYQILDDENHVRGQWEISRTGALYDLYGRSDDSSVKPFGEWNTARIVAQGNRLQHWLNGVKVIDVEVGSEEWKARFLKSKNTKDPEKTNWNFGLPEGRIWLQDHGGEVWYRNMKIQRL